MTKNMSLQELSDMPGNEGRMASKILELEKRIALLEIQFIDGLNKVSNLLKDIQTGGKG